MYPYGFPPAPIVELLSLGFFGNSVMQLGSDVSLNMSVAGSSAMTLNMAVLVFGPSTNLPAIMAEALPTPIVETLMVDSDGRMLDPDFEPGCD